MNGVFVERRNKNHDRQRIWSKLLHHTEAIDSGHLDIEQEQVGLESLDGFERTLSVRTFAHGYDAGMPAEQTAQPLSRQWFVINDEDANFAFGKVEHGGISHKGHGGAQRNFLTGDGDDARMERAVPAILHYLFSIFVAFTIRSGKASLLLR